MRNLGSIIQLPLDLARSAIKTAWDAQGIGYLDYSKFNTFCLAAFHQLDLRVVKAWYYNKWNHG